MQGRDDKHDKHEHQTSVPEAMTDGKIFGSKPSKPPGIRPKTRGEDQEPGHLVDEIDGPIARKPQVLLLSCCGIGLLISARKGNQSGNSNTQQHEVTSDGSRQNHDREGKQNICQARGNSPTPSRRLSPPDSPPSRPKNGGQNCERGGDKQMAQMQKTDMSVNHLQNVPK